MKFIYYSLGVLLVIAWGAGCLKYPHHKEVHLLLAMALLTGSVLSYRKKPVVWQDPKQATQQGTPGEQRADYGAAREELYQSAGSNESTRALLS